MEQQVYMTPKQPFFVTSSKSYYKYIFNRFGIVHFYQCNTGAHPRYAIPDGCVDMVFCCGKNKPSAEICGTVLSREPVLLESEACYFGVRFLPGYNPILGHTPDIMKDLVGHRVPLTDLIHDDRMFEGICGTTDFRQQVAAFLHSYLSIYRRVAPMEHSNLLVLHASNLLIRSAGSIAIDQIAEETGYTTRYLDKCFRTETGLSPKQLAKIVRFQMAVSALNDPMGRTLTEIAIDTGFYDQSHLVHEFKRYADLTPKQYQALLRDDSFYQKLQVVEDRVQAAG